MQTATPSTQPLAENDARPARPPVFQTLAGAQMAAQRAARAESPVQLCQRVTGVGPFGAWSATDGEAVFAVHMDPIGDFEVRPMSANEVGRLQQAGLRFEAERERDKAAEHEASAALAREGSSLRRFHEHYAAEHRERARAVETKLILSSVIDTPFTSSERDSRHAEAR